jgi:hypothetical protein
MTFSFLSTTQDLVDAYDAQVLRNAPVRGVFRWLLLAFAWLWFLGGGYTLIGGSEPLKGLFFLLCGGGILWRQSGRRLLDLHRIRASSAPEQQTSVSFSAEGVDVVVADGPSVHKRWEQLLATERTRRGLVFVFNDGVHWLPRRAFSSEQEIESLVDLLSRNSGLFGGGTPQSRPSARGRRGSAGVSKDTSREPP